VSKAREGQQYSLLRRSHAAAFTDTSGSRVFSHQRFMAALAVATADFTWVTSEADRLAGLFRTASLSGSVFIKCYKGRFFYFFFPAARQLGPSPDPPLISRKELQEKIPRFHSFQNYNTLSQPPAKRYCREFKLL